MNPLWASTIAAIATLMGGFLIVYHFEWAKRNGDRLTAFAAGVLVSMSLIDVVPEAISSAAESAGVWTALGFLAMYFLEHLAGDPHCAEDACPDRDISLMAYVALLAHSAVDGVALTASFEVSHGFGVMVGLGVILHKFTEGLAAGALLLHRGFSRQRVFLLTALVAAVTLLGTFAATHIFPASKEMNWRYPFLAAIAGSFIYTGVAGLLIHSHRKKDSSIIVCFVAGFSIFLMLGIRSHFF